MREMSNVYKMLVGREEKVILKWVLRKCGVRVRTEFNWFRIGICGSLS
jgi:hypothetical protein